MKSYKMPTPVAYEGGKTKYVSTQSERLLGSLILFKK